MTDYQRLILKCHRDVEFEMRHLSRRPLRGPQAEMVNKCEAHIARHDGEVMTIKSSRQTGKNDVTAVMQRRHLHRRQNDPLYQCWIRTAPTHKPQIVNSKKRLREHLNLSTSNIIRHPLFSNERLTKEEGYIWRLGNAAVEFLSSGPQSNVIGGTASTVLDMDEAHKIDKDKFDEDFAPFTADTNAGTLLWGVGGNGLDTLQWYIDSNNDRGKGHLNLFYPCDYWMDVHPPYREHVEKRVNVLGWDHPVILTQYRLKSIAAKGRFINTKQAMSMYGRTHERIRSPKYGRRYQMIVDIAGGNEEFNPDNLLQGFEDVDTDSTAVIIYEVTDQLSKNGIFPIIRIVDIIWLTGTDIGIDEDMVKTAIKHWSPEKVCIDAVGVGKQLAESMVRSFGPSMINAYTASDTDVSEDCFNTLARLNADSIKMFSDDDSPEWREFERQITHTQYASQKGKMKLIKPKSDKHIDIVKALTYLNQNNPVGGVMELFATGSDYGIDD